MITLENDHVNRYRQGDKVLGHFLRIETSMSNVDDFGGTHRIAYLNTFVFEHGKVTNDEQEALTRLYFGRKTRGLHSGTMLSKERLST